MQTKLLFTGNICKHYRVYPNKCALRECRTWGARLLSTKQGGQGRVGIHNRTHPDLNLDRHIIARTSLNSMSGISYFCSVFWQTNANLMPIINILHQSPWKTLNMSWKTYKTRIVIVGDNRWNIWRNHYLSAARVLGSASIMRCTCIRINTVSYIYCRKVFVDDIFLL